MVYQSSIRVEDKSGDLFSMFEDYAGSTDRSSVNIIKDAEFVVFDITAQDSVALRATLNSITKLFTTYEKIEGVLDEN